MSSSVTTRKLKILCLHGFYQSGPIFNKKTGSFRKYFAKLADFEYITAPHAVDPSLMSGGDEPEGPVYTWWHLQSDVPWRNLDVYRDIEKSIDAVKKAIIEQGPYDGILGFSMGGVFVSILTALAAAGDPVLSTLNFAIIVSAYKPTATAYAQYFKSEISEWKLPFPILLLYGASDTLVLPDDTMSLVNFFPNASVFQHKGGHFVPTDAESKKVIKVFLEQQTQ